MDDKEKEKFGVIIDKNNQPEGEKPQVEDKPSESSEQNQKDVNENQNLSEDQPKVDIVSENETEKSSDNVNLSSPEKNSQENKVEVAEKTNEIQNDEKNNEQEKKEHQVIHKKDGRLHIYVRQDKYKGELKSKKLGWKTL